MAGDPGACRRPHPGATIPWLPRRDRPRLSGRQAKPGVWAAWWACRESARHPLAVAEALLTSPAQRQGFAQECRVARLKRRGPGKSGRGRGAIAEAQMGDAGKIMRIGAEDAAIVR